MVLFTPLWIIFLASFIAGLAGVGGGGLYVPILLLAWKFPFSTCTYYSQYIVLGSATAQTIRNFFFDRNPKDAAKSLIYFNIVALLLPLQLGGNIVGGVLSKIFPTNVTYSLAIIVLYIAVFKLTIKFYYAWKQENIGYNSDLSDNLMPKESVASNLSRLELGNKDSILPPTHKSSDSLESINNNNNNTSSNSSNNAHPPLKLPMTSIYRLLGMYFVFYALMVSKLVFKACSPGYDALITVSYIPLVAQVVYTYKYVEPLDLFDSAFISKTKDEVFYLMPILIPSVFVIGIMCSLLGIGGGELLGPVLMILNIDPIISSATIPVFDLFSCLFNIGSNSVQGNNVNANLAVAGFFVGLVGALIGRIGGFFVQNNTKHPSLLYLFFLVTLVVASIIYFYDFSRGNFTTKFAEFC